MLAKIWNYSEWITETTPDELTRAFSKMLVASGFTILDECEYYFEPQGYTKIFLLCESHFAIHTFPEHGKTYIELSSCNEKMFGKFIKMVNKEWKIIKE